MPNVLPVIASAVKSIRQMAERYPVTRGMATYALLWPAGNLLQQGLDGSRTAWDILEAGRYGAYGALITAPLLYHWVGVLSRLLPGSSLTHALAKGYLDQLVFAPLNISQFFLGMALLEGRPLHESVAEWRSKFIPTWLISLSIWPLVQTLNFRLVAEKNRVMAISCGSFLWMVFLSYMHHTHARDLPEALTNRRVHYDYKHGSLEKLASCTASFTAAHGTAPELWRGPSFPTTAHCCGREEVSHQDFVVVRTS